MSDKTEGRFEGMVLAKLAALEERLEEVLESLHEIQRRSMHEQAAHATLAAEVQALHEKTGFLTRALWGAVAWILVSMAGLLLAAIGFAR